MRWQIRIDDARAKKETDYRIEARASMSKKVRRVVQNGFMICKECGAVVVDELWEKHANIHWPEKTWNTQLNHFTDTYEVDLRDEERY